MVLCVDQGILLLMNEITTHSTYIYVLTKNYHLKLNPLLSIIFSLTVKKQEPCFEFNNAARNCPCQIVWTCITVPGKQLFRVGNAFLEKICKMKDIFKPLASVEDGSLIFVFEHPTREEAVEMLKKREEIEAILREFIYDIDTSVKQIQITSQLKELNQQDHYSLDNSGSSYALYWLDNVIYCRTDQTVF